MMKKVCFVIEKLYNGGAERVVSILSNALMQSGYNVTIVCFERNDNEYRVNDSVNREFIISRNGIADKFLRTVKYLLKSDFDTIIGFDILPNLICSFVSIFTRKKIIISERNAPKQVNINPILKIMRVVLYGFADAIVFQTNEAMNCYRRGIAKKGIVIKNPISTDLPKRSNVHKKEIVAMGRLTNQKNYPLLINAAKLIHSTYPEYIFKIFGQGELEAELRRLIADNKAEKYIKLEGYYSNVCQQIVDSDIYVLTSYYEGMPNSLIEAMYMGFPVVSSDCPSGGPRELIKHGENGLLFRNNDLDDLVEQIIKLIDDIGYREKMAAEAKKIVDEVSQTKIIEKWIEIID